MEKTEFVAIERGADGAVDLDGVEESAEFKLMLVNSTSFVPLIEAWSGTVHYPTDC